MIRIEGTATAQEPIIHGGDRTGGTITPFRREKMRVDGRFEYMPIVSANSVAGILRDQCAFWCLDQIEFTQFDDLRAFDLLTSGGSLVKRKDTKKYIDLFEEHELRSLFPVVSLFGASIGNRILGGRIDVDRWIPVCVETRSALPDELITPPDDATPALADQFHIEDLLQELQFARRDDKENRDWQSYIAPAVLAAHQHEQAARAEKEESDAPGRSQKMRYGYEALAQGTLLSVGFTLRNPTPVELGVFFGGLGYFYERPKIGGRGARGFGRVKLDLRQYQLVGPGKVEHPLAIDSVAAAHDHLIEHKSQIEQALQGGAM
jgi:CRISPR type IV-associated protein Csf2